MINFSQNSDSFRELSIFQALHFLTFQSILVKFILNIRKKNFVYRLIPIRIQFELIFDEFSNKVAFIVDSDNSTENGDIDIIRRCVRVRPFVATLKCYHFANAVVSKMPFSITSLISYKNMNGICISRRTDVR